jgi:hypothetical protein
MPVEVKGLDETLKAIRKFEPDLAINLNKQVRAALQPVQKQAQALVPSELPGLSNWNFSSSGRKITSRSSAFAQVGRFPKFNASVVRRNIKITIGKTKKNRSGFISFYRLSNITAAGAIMETAGRKNPSGQPWNPKSKSHNYSHSRNPMAGQHFIDALGANMVGKDKSRGRVLYKACSENEGKALAITIKAVEMTVAQFKRRADAQKLGTL